jgi:hypothetical protein
MKTTSASHGGNSGAIPSLKSSDIVHSFGLGKNELVSKLAMLLSLDKGIHFMASEKGKETFQNFRCYTGKPPQRSKQDEGRVRTALSLMYKEIDVETAIILAIKMPSVEDGGISMWNQRRNKIASDIQERAIDTLSREEAKYTVDATKRSAPQVLTFLHSYDKLRTSKHNYSAMQLNDSMRNFLDKSSSTSSSSSSSK